MLYWEAIKFSIEQSFRRFDFGRSTPNEGTITGIGNESTWANDRSTYSLGAALHVTGSPTGPKRQPPSLPNWHIDDFLIEGNQRI
jgi:hypothetical protein